jgi:aminobenzoyl-glutamate utilization protein B
MPAIAVLLQLMKWTVMKGFSFALCIGLCLSTSLRGQDELPNCIADLDAAYEKYADIALQIWDYAELGYQEFKSSALLQQTLQDAGFTIRNGVAGMPTAFVAEGGSGSPVIGILGEYDALPGISQTASPTREPRAGVTAGHACGHHLFGTASAAAAIAIKDWLAESGNPGTIRFYGTPAEEGGAGKVYLVRDGFFDDVDAVMHWHPSNGNNADAASSLANKSAKFRFYGNAAHASGAPHFGRSALDGVEAMNMMANMMREHIPSDSRLHYVITSGGEAPNVVPEFAEVFYYCRHPEMTIAEENFQWLVKIAEAAAMGTQTRMEYEVIHGIYSLMPNATLAAVMYKNLNRIGGVTYTAEELEFAESIKSSLMNPDANLENARIVTPFRVQEKGSGGSTDVGDVSWVVPTVGLRVATWVPGTSAHSWQAVAAGGTSIGTRGMMVAAKTLTLTGIDLFQDAELLQKAKDELTRRRGSSFEYTPLIGDREPPLDYRD